MMKKEERLEDVRVVFNAYTDDMTLEEFGEARTEHFGDALLVCPDGVGVWESLTRGQIEETLRAEEPEKKMLELLRSVCRDEKVKLFAWHTTWQRYGIAFLPCGSSSEKHRND